MRGLFNDTRVEIALFAAQELIDSQRSREYFFNGECNRVMIGFIAWPDRVYHSAQSNKFAMTVCTFCCTS